MGAHLSGPKENLSDLGKNGSQTFGQVDAMQFSGSLRRMAGFVKDGGPPL